jgi:hypothetical protein
MEGEDGEVSQSFVWNRCRETVPPLSCEKGGVLFCQVFLFPCFEGLY